MAGEHDGRHRIHILRRDVRCLPVAVARLVGNDADGPGAGDGEQAAIELRRAGDNIAGGQAAAGSGGKGDGAADGEIAHGRECNRLSGAQRWQHQIGHELIAPGITDGAIIRVTKTPKRAIDGGDERLVQALERHKPARRSAHLGGRAARVYPPVAQLIVGIETPAPQGAIGLGAQCLMSAGDDRAPGSVRANLDRD